MPLTYVGVSTAVQAPNSAPAALNGMSAVQPENGVDDINLASIAQFIKATADKIAWYDKWIVQDFGDGSDGTVSVSTTVTLTRDMYYDQLTVAAGADLQTNGWMVYCKTSFTWRGGKISCNGANAAGAARGESANSGPHKMGYGGAGGNTSPSNGRNAQIVSADLSSKTGATGGSGTAGATSGGLNRGTLPSARGYKQRPYWLAGATQIHSASVDTTENNPIGAPYYAGAPGGSGGGGAAGGAGGGGAEGGGHIFIIARSITISGAPTCEAKGGNGAAGVGGNAGGGAAGCGGEAFAIYSQLTGAFPAVTATAGTNGAGVGTGTAGTGGVAGSGAFVTQQLAA